MNLKNIFWNLAGLGAPAVAAAATIPWIIALIGLERFGMISIAWGLISVAGLFDLGIGRAATQLVAKLLGESRPHEVPAVIRLAATMTLISGVAAGALFALAFVFDIQYFIKTSAEIHSEIKWGALVLAATLPLQAISATYRGINESYGDFKGISLVRVFLGVINFVGTLAVAFFNTHLAGLVAVLFFSRLIGLYVFRYLAQTHVAEASRIADLKPAELNRRSIAHELLKFGGWFTLGSGVSFVLSLSEKVGIGVVISAAAVSAYAIPFEVVIQSLVITTAISTIAFPQLSATVHADPQKAFRLFHRWLFKTCAVMLVICILMAIGLPIVLNVWVGEKLPSSAILVGQLLCIGSFARTINILCTSMIHAYGRADLITKARLIELPVYLLLLALLLATFGVYGAAWGWSIQMIADSAILYYFVRKLSLHAETVAATSTVSLPLTANSTANSAANSAANSTANSTAKTVAGKAI